MDTGSIEIKALSPKEELWNQTVERINKIERDDPHGLKIDAGVRSTVIGLNALGIKTTNSCEGHADHGSGAPYIRIADAEAQRNDRAATEAYVLQRHVDYERLNAASEKINTALYGRLTGYLDEFYGDHEVSEDGKIIAEMKLGRIALINKGSESQKDAPPDTKAANLAIYQSEIAQFGKFLEQKFFFRLLR